MTPNSSPRARRGTVYLVGAGPGDPGLLTRRAARLLRRADVIVHDALIGRRILDLTREGAEIIDVGKRCGGKRTSQECINDVLIDEARRGRIVVRLKGGDPFVFGRGGEEALALAGAGIPFEVVPGVTAGVGVSAYAGIPVTHRDLASAVTFVTGHEKDDADPRVDWSAIARVQGTVVVYMGLSNASQIAERLIAGGRPASTPAALIEWGTVARQRSVEAPLGEIAEAGRAASIAAPALLVIGEVAALRQELAWFDRLPLRGVRVVVGRSRPQPSRIARALERLGADVVETPTLRAVPLTGRPETEAALASLAEYDALLFTAPAAVRVFWNELERRGWDSRALSGLRIASLGEATTRALRRRGVSPDFSARSFQVDAVSSGIAAIVAVAGSRFLFPRDENRPSAVAADLRDRGAVIDELHLYRTVPDLLVDEPEVDTADFIILPSSTAAAQMARVLEGLEVTGQVVAIGPGTAQAALGCGLRVDIVPDRATVQGIVAAVRSAAARGRRAVTAPANRDALSALT